MCSPFLFLINLSLNFLSVTSHPSPCQYLQRKSFISLNHSLHIGLSLRLQYLGEAAGGAVLAPGGEVPELDVQQLDQLGHGPHCGWHITRTQKPFGLLCQLLGHNCRCLARTELRGKQGDGVERGIKRKNERDGWKLKKKVRWGEN